jgi:hypothetical protein
MTRNTGKEGAAAEQQGAQHFLAGLPHTPPCRFDEVFFDAADNTPQWIRNAIET